MEIATLSSMELKNEFELRDVHHAWNSKIDRFFVLADGDLHTFDLNTGKEGPIVKLRPTARDACTFSPSGKYLAVAGRGAVAIQDVTSNKLTFTLELPARARAMAFSPDERSLAAAVGDRIVVVEMASGKVRLAFAARAQALTYSADGRFLVAAMDDTTALIWDWTLLAESRRN